jgi:hypothetical protein
VLVPKKRIPNPEFEKALFRVDYIWQGGTPPKDLHIPEIRTNDPLFIARAMPDSSAIPSHIEVEED